MAIRTWLPRLVNEGRRVRTTLHGGPLAGETVYLRSGGTLPFTLYGQRGYYDQDNRWRPMT
jgi:hypothetical protein